jgi:hypothetical protein
VSVAPVKLKVTLMLPCKTPRCITTSLHFRQRLTNPVPLPAGDMALRSARSSHKLRSHIYDRYCITRPSTVSYTTLISSSNHFTSKGRLQEQRGTTCTSLLRSSELIEEELYTRILLSSSATKSQRSTLFPYYFLHHPTLAQDVLVQKYMQMYLSR